MKHDEALYLLNQVYPKLGSWLQLFQNENHSDSATRKKSEEILAELAERLKCNYPFHSDVYAGQMLKPPHQLAWAAYALTSLINPNNHAIDGGPPTSVMEKEVIPQFSEMFGFEQPCLGHLTSSGTIANLEALWVARQIHPNKAIAFSEQAHYTHRRMCEVLGLRYYTIPVDHHGNWDMNFFAEITNEIGTVVVTMGTTGMGRVEPLHLVHSHCKKSNIRIHLDAAYGGYFKLIESSGKMDATPWKLTSEADSIVIDPHKHGLQPYGCGCVLFKDPKVGKYYKHDSPYTYFSSDELHLGEISLECSRAGAAAAALWATLKLFDIRKNGEMSRLMDSYVTGAKLFSEKINSNEYFSLVEKPELDIVVYYPQTVSNKISDISAKSTAIFKKGIEMDSDGIFVSLYKMSSSMITEHNKDIINDSDTVTVLRSVLMKPGHLPSVDMLVERLVRMHKLS
jgi:glutamate/tyrosine decarboxylase-like PLP-dependent enzyme